MFSLPKLTSRRPIIISAFILLFFGINNTSIAATYFQEDFEKGHIDSTPNPQWSWKSPISGSNSDNSMMYAESDLYSVSSSVSFTGTHSLRLDFSGRNNWCNQCGTKTVTLTQDDASASCIQTTGAPWNGFVYNKTMGLASGK